MITAIGILEIEKSDNSAAERLVTLGNHDEGKDESKGSPNRKTARASLSY
jgi:hypothetical protein